MILQGGKRHHDQMNLRNSVYNVSHLEENQNAVQCFTSSKMCCSKLTIFVWQCISQPYLPMETCFAELVLDGINFLVKNWLVVSIEAVVRWTLHISHNMGTKISVSWCYYLLLPTTLSGGLISLIFLSLQGTIHNVIIVIYHPVVRFLQLVKHIS